MTHENDDRDQWLRERLLRIDPAASLPTADPARVAGLLEETTGHDPNQVVRTRSGHTRGRGPLTWVVAAAAGIVIAGGVVFTLTAGDDDPPELPAAEQSIEPGGEPASVTTLAADPAANTRCMAPTAAAIGRQDLAFEGVVQQIDTGVAVLAPTRFYAGPESDLVEVEAPAEDPALLVEAVPFEVGGTYLVAATDGRVALCGFSGPRTDRLANLYDRAFGG